MPKLPSHPPEFDSYADKYDELLQDPIRESFAAEKTFFVRRKLQVIDDFFRRRHIDSRKLRWLDVGCGMGDLLKSGRDRFASASGCDPSAKMLQACGDIEVRQQTDISQLPFESERFDFVTVVCVYHHIPMAERVAFTREALRVLRPNGILAIIEHNPWNPVTRIIVSRAPVDANAHLLSSAEVRNIIKTAGATPIGCRYFLYLPQKLHELAGFVESGLERIPMGGQYIVFSRVATAP